MDSPILSNQGVIRLSVTGEVDGQRLDQCLASEVDGLSRTLARRLIEIGGVHVDGRRMRRCGQLMRAGQQIEIYHDGFPLEPFSLEDEQILFRDKDLLVINKPPGIPVQPTPARYQGTVYAAALKLLQQLNPRQQPSLGMVQRLDRDTSGLLVFSIHPRAHKGLTESFREHLVEKRYRALVAGAMPDREGEIVSQLAKRRSTNRMVSVEKGGKHALTRYRVVEVMAAASLLEVEILTGRSHQIRVHCAEQGCPLLGDKKYGGPGRIDGMPIPRQMLHAAELGFRHPVTGEQLQFEAPLPDDFAVLFERLKNRAQLDDNETGQTGSDEEIE